MESERMRHKLQNRFRHDLNWLPTKIPRNTPHYPSLGAKGCLVFEKFKARKSYPMFQAGINSNWSY